MKVLVTGSNGLLGQKIIKNYSNNSEFEIIATGRGENRIHSISGFKYIPIDITDRNNVLEVVKEEIPQVIIHTAAMTNVDQCEEDPVGCEELNIEAVKYIVEAAEAVNAHLIHLSTDFIFDGEDGPYSEEDLPNPISHYGKSKLMAEVIVQKAQCKWSIVRTVLVIGVTEGMSRSNIVLWAKGALSQGKEIPVVDDQFRTPTLAEDLADGCMAIAQTGEEGVFNISGEEYLSILEIVERIADYYGFDKKLIKPVSSTTLNQKAKRPPKTGFILNKAKEKLNYKPHTLLESIDLIESQSIA